MMEVGPPHTRLSGVGEQTTSSCVGVKAWVVSVEEKAESNPSGVFYEVTRMPYEPSYYIDIIEYSLFPTKISLEKITSLYLQEGLSVQQIADKIGVSKTTILNRLHSLDIRKKNRIMTNLKNYRMPIAPYGFQRVNNQLVPLKKEIKICRMVVSLINNEKLSYSATARKLGEEGIKNRRGNVSWSNSVITSIYKRWNLKL